MKRKTTHSAMLLIAAMLTVGANVASAQTVESYDFKTITTSPVTQGSQVGTTNLGKNESGSFAIYFPASNTELFNINLQQQPKVA